MTYVDYIKAHNDQMERQAQLANQYNQQPIINRPKGLWASTTISKHTKHKLDILEAVLGVLIAGGIIVASIVLG